LISQEEEMTSKEASNHVSLRLTDPSMPPSDQQIEAWIGKGAFAYWRRVHDWIAQHYSGIFTPDWLFGGKKHGWSLRYKKGTSFCTFIPEKGRFNLLIVFGAKEREKVETVRQMLSARTQSAYDEATTYHDGKWLLLTVDADDVFSDIRHLLEVKRKPK
jgi:hypothetical protein